MKEKLGNKLWGYNTEYVVFLSRQYENTIINDGFFTQVEDCANLCTFKALNGNIYHFDFLDITDLEYFKVFKKENYEN